MYIPQLSQNNLEFPNPKVTTQEGIVAYGGDLNPVRIYNAYRKGIFPWFSKGEPILWWCPDPRFVLKIEDFKLSKSLSKTIRKNIFEVKFDTNFKAVITNCAKIKRVHEDGTWITDEMIEAYVSLFERGDAHSFESYYNGELVGGGYGICVGDIFCGESMFSTKTDASKVAFVSLVEKLKEKGFSIIDSQVYTDHLASFGTKEIRRDEYLSLLKRGLENPKYF